MTNYADYWPTRILRNRMSTGSGTPQRPSYDSSDDDDERAYFTDDDDDDMYRGSTNPLFVHPHRQQQQQLDSEDLRAWMGTNSAAANPPRYSYDSSDNDSFGSVTHHNSLDDDSTDGIIPFAETDDNPIEIVRTHKDRLVYAESVEDVDRDVVRQRFYALPESDQCVQDDALVPRMSYYLVDSYWLKDFFAFVGDPQDGAASSSQHATTATSAAQHPTNAASTSEQSASTSQQPATGPSTNTETGTSHPPTLPVSPGVLHNYNLFLHNGVPDDRVRPVEDYRLVSARMWALIRDCFGGGPELKRVAYNNHGSIDIDFAGTHVLVCRSSEPTKFHQVTLSKFSTVGEVNRQFAAEFAIPVDSFRLWDYFDRKLYACLRDVSRTVDAMNLQDHQHMILEEKSNGEFQWPPELSGASIGLDGMPVPEAEIPTASAYPYASSRGGGRYDDSEDRVVRKHSGEGVAIPGIVGLSNLGNTCYMNSMIQCLSNTPPLHAYFESGQQKLDKNVDNPLGTKGELVDAFASLLELMWRTENVAQVSPLAFKRVVSTFKHDFAGFSQHDSQEFLSFVLDGLHEDLNRVLHKPYVENVEAKGRPDEAVAQESLQAHLLRNDSFVNDLFMGQFKSTVVCPEKDCGFVSVTFDPYLCAQLPLKENGRSAMLSVKLLVQDTTNWASRKVVEVLVQDDGIVMDVKHQLAKMLGVSIESVVIAELWGSKLHNVLDDLDEVSRFSPRDEFIVYVLPGAEEFVKQMTSTDSVAWRRPLNEGVSVGHRNAQPEEDPAQVAQTKEAKVGHVAVKLGQDESPAMRPYCASSEFLCVGDVFLGRFIHMYNNRSARMLITKVQPPGADGRVRFHGVVDCEDRSSIDEEHEVNQTAWSIVGMFRPDIPAQSEGGVDVESPKSPSHVLGSLSFQLDEMVWTVGDRHAQFSAGIGTVEDTGMYFFGQLTNQSLGSTFGSFVFKRASEAALARVDGSSFGAGSGEEGVDLPREASVPPPLPPRPHHKSVKLVVAHKKLQRVRGVATSTFMGTPMLLDCDATISERDLHSMIQTGIFQLTRLGNEHAESFLKEVENCFRVVFANEFYGIDATRSREPRENVGHILDAASDRAAFHLQTDGVEYAVVVWNFRSLKELSLKYAESPMDEDETIDEVMFKEESVDQLSGGEESEINIYDCFDLFTKQEQLSEQDAWYCPRCKAHREAFKQIEIWSLPKVLITQLKRFSQDASHTFVDKLDTKVNFPLSNLDLTDRCLQPESKENAIYDLYAVSNHFGGLGGGHYTAYCRNANNGFWYEFDDSLVRPVGDDPETFVCSSASYVLFYLRRDLAPEVWGRAVKDLSMV